MKKSFILSPKSVQLTRIVLERYKSNKMVTIVGSRLNNYARIKVGDFSIQTRTIGARYPDWRSVLRPYNMNVFNLNTNLLQRKIGFFASFFVELLMKFNLSTLTLKGYNAHLEGMLASETIDLDEKPTIFDNKDVLFSSRIIRSVMKRVLTERVQFQIPSVNNDPVLILPIEEQGSRIETLYLVMPKSLSSLGFENNEYNSF